MLTDTLGVWFNHKWSCMCNVSIILKMKSFISMKILKKPQENPQTKLCLNKTWIILVMMGWEGQKFS